MHQAIQDAVGDGGVADPDAAQAARESVVQPAQVSPESCVKNVLQNFFGICGWGCFRIVLTEVHPPQSLSPTFSRVLDSEAFCPFGVDG